MFGEGKRLIRLSSDYVIKPFDCGDHDLNEFLAEDAKLYLNQLLAVTYLLENETDTIAFFSVSNDKIAYQDFRKEDGQLLKGRWRKFKGIFPHRKRISSYPSVKIGRIGVDLKYANNGFGSKIMNYIKGWFLDNNKTGCRFIAVDAYQTPDALAYYQKNGFDFLSDKDEGEQTRLMYFDLAQYQ